MPGDVARSSSRHVSVVQDPCPPGRGPSCPLRFLFAIVLALNYHECHKSLLFLFFFSPCSMYFLFLFTSL
ncbi:zinc finger, C3HC4 type, domain containing protein [Musa troglodytarum]|uniref:Zinc finger, C3HC4 type, domain containing protein n=1 Tax=Musa troglodytarum TaxID=320322 RepID=A0A9E7HHI3_9LILI|nr:zinc finger, C3HC4 type, domain containing protein [Musa troglodytarum]